jgi:hypothetical protein
MPCLLIIRKTYREFPAFFVYILGSLFQCAALPLIDQSGADPSSGARRMSWMVQALALTARPAAVFELSRNLLARFRGVWALANRIFFSRGALVYLGTLAFVRYQPQFILASTDVVTELAIAVVIVVLLLFARYYDVPAAPPLMPIAAGLCFYSCVWALEDALLQSNLLPNVPLGDALPPLALLVCVVPWINAFRRWTARPPAPELSLNRSVYFELAPEINSRLPLLNEQLARLCKMEWARP